jgi:aerotaxis receptor
VLAGALFATGASWAALGVSALVMLLGTLLFEQQIVRPVENVARQALKVATGERNSVEHLNRSDELADPARRRATRADVPLADQ